MNLITYVPDLKVMKTEAITIQSDENNELAKHFTIENSEVSFNATKIPVIYSSDGSTLCLIQNIDRSVIESSSSIRVIGECINGEYVFDEGGRDIYESIYDTSTRMIEVDEGVKIEYTPPYEMGGFT